ncbi:uncharacterized protein IL334_004774 [Kwoniella shivajii]|uniref:Reverse transcriptase RNase H-like domain-containing protein n=1 Tax=Kwoniella shivajii TaxID=564305 RepID=A0ABZ1D1M8_9TREE|nr:hypothetical protein IL334_004774 [Kwoniella shivajii]
MTKLSSSLSYKLLRRWDGFLRCLPPFFIPARWEVWSDASGKGYGGHLGPQSRPLDVWQEAHPYLSNGKGSTEYVEAKAVLLSLNKWKNVLKGKKVWCYVDNYQVYQTLNKRYSYQLNHNHNHNPNHTTNSNSTKLYFTPNPFFLSTSLITFQTTPPYSHESQDQDRTQGEMQIPEPKPKPQEKEKEIKCPKVRSTFEEIDKLIKENQITLRARWVWGKDNVLADRLSRLGKGDGRGTLTPHVRQLLDAAKRSTQDVLSEDSSISGSSSTRVA